MLPYKNNIVLLFVFFILQGCAITNIPLKEVVYPSGAIPSVQSKSAVIVTLQDNRGIDSIGLTNDGVEIIVKGNVASWATKNLASVLQKAGYSVSIASSLEEIRTAPMYIVTGSIEELHLEVNGMSSTASVKVMIKTIDKEGKVAVETFSSSCSAINNPFSDTEATIVLEALLQAYADIPSLLR